MPRQTDTEILTWLAEHEGATAFDVSRASEMNIHSVRSRLRYLERHKLVTGSPNGAVPPYRAYSVTDEGRRKVVET